MWLFRTGSCLGAFEALAWKCLVLIRRAWVDLANCGMLAISYHLTLEHRCWSCIPLIMRMHVREVSVHNNVGIKVHT